MSPSFINKSNNINAGFTLVELLVVISLVGILAGVTISIINPVKQRQVAEDGVRQSNLQKFALGVEAYGNANSEYPASPIAVDANNAPTVAEVKVYISKIPNNEPTSPLTYTYVSGSGTFGVSVPLASDSTKCYKYHSSWGKIQECLNANCGVNSNVNSCN